MWIDAVRGDGWSNKDDLPEPRIMRSRGWLIVDKPEYIVVVGTLDADAGGYGEAIAIPTGMVQSQKVLK